MKVDIRKLTHGHSNSYFQMKIDKGQAIFW